MKTLIIIIISFYSSLFSDQLRKNFQVIDSLAEITNTELINTIINRGKKGFVPVFNESPKYLQSIFISKMYELDIKTKGDSIDINFLKYKPIYSYKDDTLFRKIDYLISSNQLEIINRTSFINKFEKEDLIYIEDSEFIFDKAILPKKESSFYKKYLEPSIIILSSLVTVLLLFTVRSS